MYRTERFGPVVRIRMARTLLGKPLQWVNAFWVDGMLIDSGCRHTAPELMRALEREGLTVEQLINTHTHEDHVGANRDLQQRYGVKPRAHPLGMFRLTAPETAREMAGYRRFFWGLAEGCREVGEPLGETVATDRYRFRLYHTPGHAPDHVVLLEEREGWLFSGDLLISPRLVHIRAPEDPQQILASMRLVVTLPVKRIFCAHAFKVEDGLEPFHAKIASWERLQAEALRLGAAGLTPAQITRRLLGGRSLIEWVTLGDYAKRHLIAGLMRGGAGHHTARSVG